MKYIKMILMTLPFFMLNVHASNNSLKHGSKSHQENHRKGNIKKNGKNGKNGIKGINHGNGENGGDGMNGGNGGKGGDGANG
ncbi:hypothetical protein MVS59_005055 [Salmonella enterica]|nr:hypothetical protein [Salmonella enterica subsp. diarizonae serovar 48:i:z]EEH1875771.1 hypothetical protein [Salmonella enterica]EEM2740588.1 hypothetical protein [Salmonella enterica]EEM9673181.1 hypothetical protein [Salmonella enterica]EEN5932696.1 hypothetical protein [Salmonella enterica]